MSARSPAHRIDDYLREWYTTHEFAKAVGKAEFTIREYCRLGRLVAEKRQSGRGAYPQWVLSQAELLRFQRNGLLPLQRTSAQPYVGKAT